MKETKRLPAVTAIKDGSELPTTNLKTKVLSSIGSLLKKANLLAWWRARRAKATKPSAQSFSKAPVQAELSLDKIKVLRNDLSEGDLEVVPVKISVKAKPEKSVVQPAARAEETAELIKT